MLDSFPVEEELRHLGGGIKTETLASRRIAEMSCCSKLQELNTSGEK